MIIKINPKKSNFLETNLETICGNDELRPAMQCVYFKNGFVYATNAYVAIKQHLSLHDIDDDAAKLLDGKLLHKDHLKLMKRCDLFEITPEGIKSKKGLLSMVHQFLDDKFPDVDSVIPSSSELKLEMISINADNLNIIQKAMIHESTPFIKIHFSSGTKPFLVSSKIEIEKQVGIIAKTISGHEEK